MDPQQRIDALLTTCAMLERALDRARARLDDASQSHQLVLTECIVEIHGEISFWTSELQRCQRLAQREQVVVVHVGDQPRGKSWFSVDADMFGMAGCAAKSPLIFVIFLVACTAQFFVFFTFFAATGVHGNALWDACKLGAAHISHTPRLQWPIKLLELVVLVVVLCFIGSHTILKSAAYKCDAAGTTSSMSFNGSNLDNSSTSSFPSNSSDSLSCSNSSN